MDAGWTRCECLAVELTQTLAAGPKAKSQMGRDSESSDNKVAATQVQPPR